MLPNEVADSYRAPIVINSAGKERELHQAWEAVLHKPPYRPSAQISDIHVNPKPGKRKP